MVAFRKLFAALLFCTVIGAALIMSLSARVTSDELARSAGTGYSNASVKKRGVQHQKHVPPLIKGDTDDTPKIRKPKATRKPGRDGIDHSHAGMVADPTDGMLHAWSAQHSDPNECFGAAPIARCVDDDSVQWFKENMLLSIITGAEGAFRVEVSQCTWLAHIPPENVFVFSDLVPLPGHNRTPHKWVKGQLPATVYEQNGDIFSPSITEGYVKVVRKRGQGYSAAWIVAQFRFAQAVDVMYDTYEQQKKRTTDAAGGAGGGGGGLKWFMIGDDDTIVQLPNLVKRLKQIDHTKPYYLSRKGWGGAGHIYSVAALEQLKKTLPQCVDKYFVRGFRASDDMLLKCAHMAKLHCQMEDTMSHCPASHLGVQHLLSDKQATFHGKKDFYPPVLLTTWRVSLYYYAAYCKNEKAAELATWYSACAFGSCKQHGCTKEKNDEVKKKWLSLSRNNTITQLPFAEFGTRD